MTVTEGASGGVPGWPTPLAFLYSVAMETGIGVRDYPDGHPHSDGDTAAIVVDGKVIALNSALADDGLRADVLAMALEVATVMTDRPGSGPGAIYAAGGFVVITRNRIPAPPAGSVGSLPSWPASPAGTPRPRRSSTTSPNSATAPLKLASDDHQRSSICLATSVQRSKFTGLPIDALAGRGAAASRKCPARTP